MKIALPKQEGGWHLLTNEGLVVGDKVFPILDSYHTEGQLFITDMIRLSDDPMKVLACTGWPTEPHTIREFYQQNGLQWVQTDKGYSPKDVYFKLTTINAVPLNRNEKTDAESDSGHLSWCFIEGAYDPETLGNNEWLTGCPCCGANCWENLSAAQIAERDEYYNENKRKDGR